MRDDSTPIGALKARVTAFCEERDWDQFHNARNLAIGIVTEAAELLEIFRFRSDDEIAALMGDPEKRRRVEQEVADVLFFVVRLAQRHGIDLAAAFEAKLAINAERYPVEKSRGSNRKHTEL